MKATDLTILLTLKGRHLHTLRWLWHANRTCLSAHVIVADGEVHPTIARILSNPATFPNLSFEYHRYADHSFTDFYSKCFDALQKVRTPYVMMSDNDDFLLPTGLQKSVDFLDAAPDYVCAGGGVPGFRVDPRSSVAPNVVGPLRRMSYRYYTQHERDLDNPSIALRALDEIRNYLCLYYHVYRVEALRVIAHDILTYDFSDADIHEKYWALRALTLGKVRCDTSVLSYFRQAATSLSSAYPVDWVHHLLGSRFPQDFRALASKIAAEAARVDGCDPAELEHQIREDYATGLRRLLANTLLRYRFPNLFRLKQRFLTLRMLLDRMVPASIRRELDETRFWKQVALGGADCNTIASHKMELRDIEATLQGDEFIEFLHHNAADLIPRQDGARSPVLTNPNRDISHVGM